MLHILLIMVKLGLWLSGGKLYKVEVAELSLKRAIFKINLASKYVLIKPKSTQEDVQV